MAKEEIDRAARAGAGDVVGAPKQQDVAELLKKMKVEAEADAKTAATTPENTSEAAASSEAQPEAQQIASADSVFATDASYEVASAGMTAADGGAAGGGVSTGTLLAIGGVALVAGGIAIAANNDDNDKGGGNDVDTVTGPASADEGTVVNFAVKGSPGATFSWSLSGTAANGNDVSSPLTGQVTLDDQGNAIVSVTLASDQAVEGAETLTLTVGDVASAPVAVNDVLPPAEDAILTPETDNLDFSNTSGANIVSGTATGISGLVDDGTFTAGDKIVGNGSTIFDLQIQAGGIQPGATTLTNIAAIDIVNASGGSVSTTFDASGWTGIGSINLVDGADGMQLNVTDLHHGIGRSIASGVAGSIYVEYTDDIEAEIRAGHVSSISQSAAGDVEANVIANEYASFSTWYTGPAPADIVVGNVNAEVGDNGYFGAFAWHTGGDGDITVGDVSVTGGDSASVDVTAYASNYNQGGLHNIALGNIAVAVGNSGDVSVSVTNTGYNEVGNIAVGEVSIAVGNSGSADFTVENYASANNSSDDVTVGNVTVGDVTLAGGDSASISGWISNYAYGRDGVITAGNVVVGDVDVSVGSGISATADFYVYNFAYATDEGSAAIGDVTVGDVSLSGGKSASVYMSVSASAYASNGGPTTAGNLVIGNVDMGIGQSGDIGFYVNFSADANQGAASIGDVSIGNLNFDIATSASGSKDYYITATAAAGGDASVGNVVIGDTTGSLGVNAYMSDSIYVSAYASGGGAASIGDVTIGSVNVDLNDGASYSNYVSIYAYDSNSTASVGNVSFGDVGVFSTNGVSSSASVYYYNYVYGDIASVSYGNVDAVVGATATAYVTLDSFSKSVGDVTLGNVDVAATGDGAYFYGELSVSAWSGDIGNVTVGDVAVSAALNGTAYWDIYLSADDGDIGNVTVGNVSVDAGTGGYATFYLSAEAYTAAVGGGDIGNISIGNLSVAAVGAGAYGYAGVYNYATHDTGTFTVGDISLNVDAGAAAGVQAATVTVELYTSLGDISTGNVAIDFAGTDADADIDTHNVYLTITASNDVTLGDISVSGGDGAAENLDYVNGVSAADFAASVMLNVSAGGDITIGGVDYSGFGEAATINVSAFKGAATIIGSAFDDLITDNAGTNAITGGAGSDTFAFQATNTGKTAATADTIADFVYGEDLIDITPVVNVGNYSEGTYADFAAFLAAADAGDKAVLSGQVGADVWLAVDDNTDGTVDYVIGLLDSNLANVAVDSFV